MRKYFKIKKGNLVEVFVKFVSFGKGIILIYNVNVFKYLYYCENCICILFNLF